MNDTVLYGMTLILLAALILVTCYIHRRITRSQRKPDAFNPRRYRA